MTTTRTALPFLRTGGLLRPVLRLDALVTGANAAAYLLAAPLLDGLLGLPAGLLRGVGAFLAGYAVAVWLVAARRPISAPAAEVVVGANVLWVVGSLAAVLTGLGSPSTVGAVWLVLQAAVVAGFAGLQVAGLRGARQARAHG
ncbi:hypothetical protein [Blastococcus xanthinilyticus]|uniref:Integral membrane protein n=1 Tax=Blastococcus xanthinilyticus TaxID=1564164 RepID=A0A5S5CSH3_9ACTN|nr:hypothetical protein [Blastococcus xanthinilyticus]TYP86555.1 hypothetical protein BD833_109160 [Blastococcus xanthinilyticus]